MRVTSIEYGVDVFHDPDESVAEEGNVKTSITPSCVIEVSIEIGTWTSADVVVASDLAKEEKLMVADHLYGLNP